MCRSGAAFSDLQSRGKHEAAAAFDRGDGRTDGRCGGGEKKDKNGLTRPRPVARSVINLCRPSSVGRPPPLSASRGLARSLAPSPSLVRSVLK